LDEEEEYKFGILIEKVWIPNGERLLSLPFFQALLKGKTCNSLSAQWKRPSKGKARQEPLEDIQDEDAPDVNVPWFLR
jgi:hypothetical protein